jgi:hypothetical protein
VSAVSGRVEAQQANPFVDQAGVLTLLR